MQISHFLLQLQSGRTKLFKDKLKYFVYSLSALYRIISKFNDPEKEAIENIVGENWSSTFSQTPQCSLCFQKFYPPIAFDWDKYENFTLWLRFNAILAMNRSRLVTK